MELRLGRRSLAVSAIAAALTAAAGVGGFSLSRSHARADERASFLAAAVPAIASFSGAVESAITGAAQLGASGVDPTTATDAAATRSGLDAMVSVAPQPDGTGAAAIAAVAAHRVPLTPDPPTTALLDATFDAARDRGEVRATPAIPAAGGGVILVVVPRYRAGELTATTAQRRMAIERFSVGVLRPAPTARELFSPLAQLGSVAVSDGDVRLFTSGRGERDDVSVRVPVAGRLWTVTAGLDEDSTGAFPPLVLAAGLALGALILAAGRRSYEVERRATAEAAAREADLEAVAQIGPLLQESLDLADVLPAASAFLAETFHLDGVSVSYADEGGGLVEAFTIGRRLVGVPTVTTELRSPPTHLYAGEVAAVPLLRGGRVIGALHALAGADLSTARTRTFVTVAERVGTAVANARQFEREREAVRRLTEIDRLQNEFLGTVSHELQTPITAMLGFSSMLDEQYDDLTPEERRDFVRRVARNANSLSSLVRELLDFSRLGRRQFELHPHEIDLSELTTGIVEQFAGLVERHRITLHAPAGIWALADPDAVERVLSNLLSNAAKYSPPGTAITVTLAHDGAQATIVVDDAGPGVSTEDAPHVFRRFYRGASPAAMETRGAGIGLAVVKELVERMGGTVSVGAAPGGGARFAVTLPVHKREPADPSPPPSEPAGQGRAS